VDRIAEKTGIEQRHIAGANECSSDLAYAAAQKLFASGVCRPDEIDYILLCTQSPDYVLPTTACLLQHRLGIPETAGALDFNLGCSGYIYGLGLAHGLIGTGQASKLLLLTAETYSKFLDPTDRSVVTIFGDAGAATLICSDSADNEPLTPAYVYGTNGAGAEHLIVHAGARRDADESLQTKCEAKYLRMNGPEIFRFTLQVVPDCIKQLLAKTGKKLSDIDLFVFHQANRYMLEHLRRKLSIEEDRFYIHLQDCGNTVSSTIPIALKNAMEEGRLKNKQLVMLVGFGVGLSWGATLLQWPHLGSAPSC
jgi:3-oxoacyl-[acyl-carrier-protein] synthase-3